MMMGLLYYGEKLMVEATDYNTACNTLAKFIYMKTYDMTGEEFDLQLSYELEYVYHNVSQIVKQMIDLDKLGEDNHK